MEDIAPDNLGGPAHEAVIERLARAIAVGRVGLVGQPYIKTWMTPLMTRRSSTRGLPLVSVGRSGSSRTNCMSFREKWFRTIVGLLSETVNYKCTPEGNPFMGPDASHRAAEPHCLAATS